MQIDYQTNNSPPQLTNFDTFILILMHCFAFFTFQSSKCIRIGVYFTKPCADGQMQILIDSGFADVK